MNRTAARLTGFAVLLAVLFTGGWAAGAQFPTDGDPAPHETDHSTDGDTSEHGGGEDTP